MEQLKNMKEALVQKTEAQIYGHMDTVDAKELGEAIDMIKDLSEAIYYCTITEAMEQESHVDGKHGAMYYRERIDRPIEHVDPRYRELRMTDYPDRGLGGDHSSVRGYRDGMVIYPKDHDPREGRAGQRRRMYMEGKYTHGDKSKSMMELDAYVQELTSDLVEMIQDATPEEKSMLQQKISTLATKIK